MRKVLLFLLFVFCIQTIQSQQAFTKGKEFWLMFLQNYTNNPRLTVYFSSDKNTTVTIKNLNTSYTKTLTVNANTLVSDTVALSQCYNTGSGTIDNKALRITSTEDVTMYAFNYISVSADATVILPTSALGVNYRLLTYKGLSSTYRSEFGIVATQDTTIIKITPSVNTFDNKVKNVPYTVTLNKGQSFQVQAKNDSDITGTMIEVQNCKPIAVFGGTMCSNVPQTCSSCDHLYEQVFPLNTWGKEFILIPTATRNKDRYVVLADNSSTTISINGSNTTLANAGDKYEADITTPTYISSNKPISVMIYAVGQSCGGGSGDPMMMWVTPIEQNINSIIFPAITTTLISTIYVNIIARTSTVGSIKLNGTSIGSTFSTVSANSAYSYSKRSISAGANRITSDSGFTAYAFGYGTAESFGYNVGSSTLDLVRYFTVNGVRNDNHSTTLTPMKVCKDYSIAFNGVSGNYTPLYWLWKFNNDTAMTQNVTKTFTDTGIVKVQMFTAHLTSNNLCTASDTLIDTATQFIRIVEPRINILTPDTVVCYGDTFQPRIEFFDDSNIVWTGGSDVSCSNCIKPTIKPTATKWYKVSIGSASMGCIISDSVRVRLIDSVQRKVPNDTMICRGNPVNLYATVLNHDTLVHYVYKWYRGSTLLQQDTFGNYTVHPDTTTTYTLKINNGCKDFTSQVNVYVRDSLKLIYTDSFQICRVVNNSFTFKAKGGDSSYTIYLLKNNSTQDTILNAVPNTSYSFSFSPDPNAAYKFVLTDGCTVKNDTQTIHFTFRPPLGFIHTQDTMVCRDQNARLRVRAYGGDSTYTFYLLKNSSVTDSITNALYNIDYYFNITTSLNATYTMVVKDGCSTINDSQSIQVNVRDTLSFTVSNDSSVCEGYLTDIRVRPSGGDSTYTFYLLDSTAVIDTITNAQAGQLYRFFVHPTFLTNYSIVLVDGCTGRNDTQHVVYTFRPPLGFTHTQDTTICKGQAALLYFTPFGGDSTYSCSLLRNNTVIDSMIATLLVTHYFTVDPDSTTTYTIVLSDGCTYLNDTQTVVVHVRDPLGMNISNSAMICRGQTLTLTVIPSGGDSTYSIYLLDNNMVVDSVQYAASGLPYAFTIQPSLNAAYTLVLKDGCTALNDTQSVVFSFRPALSFTRTPDTTICLGNTLNIKITPSGGDSAYTLYLLENNTPVDSVENATVALDYYFTVAPVINTTYKLVMRDFCTSRNDTQTLNVSVRGPLHFAVTIDSFICEGSLTDIQLRAWGGDSTYTFYLHDSTAVVDSIVNAVNGPLYRFWVNPKFITRFRVVLDDGCTNKNDTQSIIYKFRQPLGFTHTSDTMICTGQTIPLRFKPFGGDSSYNCYLLQNNIVIDSFLNASLLVTHLFNITPTATTNYTMVLSDGCTYLNDTENIKITLRDPLSLRITNDSIICRGQHLDIHVTPHGGDSTYDLYLLKNSIVIDSVKNAVNNITYHFNVLPGLTDVYAFVLKDQCTLANDSQMVKFGFRGPLTFLRSVDTTICIGQTTDLQVTPYGGDSTYTIYLMQGSTIVDSIENALLGTTYNFNVAPVISTLYAIKITDGCTIYTDTQAIYVSVRPPLLSIITHDTLICKGQTTPIRIKASGGRGAYTLYLLLGGITLDSITGVISGPAYTFNVAPIVNTTYEIILVDGCTKLSDNKFITIGVYPPLVVKSSVTRSKICNGDSVTLHAVASGGNFNNTYTYQWNNGAGMSQTSRVYPPASVWYVVTASDGCSASPLDSVYVEVEPNPIADFTVLNASGCEQFVARFTNTSTTFTYTHYEWLFGDGASDTTAFPPPHTYVKPGTYDVTLKLVSNFGCTDSITKKGFITVYPNPQVSLKIDPKKIKVNNGKINFTAGMKFTDDYDFLFGDGQSLLAEPATSNIFNHIYTDTGYFFVKLIARNNFGCETELNDTLFIEDYYSVFIPNAFSPNGDKLNDFFKPSTSFSKRYDMHIYDRWGQLLYSETCNDRWFNCNGWDGTFNGKPVQEDAYIYLITLYEEDLSHRYYERGTVIITR